MKVVPTASCPAAPATSSVQAFMRYAGDWKRLESRVSVRKCLTAEIVGACWQWSGARDRNGYPRFWLRGVNELAARAVLIMQGRRLSSDESVVRACLTPDCINPEHLIVVPRHAALRARLNGRRPKLGAGEVWLIAHLVGDRSASPAEIAFAAGWPLEVVEGIARVACPYGQSKSSEAA